MKTTLNEILTYEHPAVVNRFKKEHPEFQDRAETIFKDLIRFFWASELHEKLKSSQPDNKDLDFVFIMDEEMRRIDQIWHIFLLYTKDYEDFCQKYFGQFIHHLPDIVPNMPQDPIAFEDNLSKFLHFTYENLGEGTVRRWFNETA
jgi:hypothetical protein